LKFHAKYTSQARTKEGKPYIILETEGKGHYIGCVLNIENVGKGLDYLMEGDLRIYVDDQQEPIYRSTGTEDYFLSGWYFAGGKFAGPFHGLTIKEADRLSAYRFHIYDPIPFKKRLKVTIDHGEHNEALGCYSSCAYWYQLP
jgi:hypothetical protein